MKDSTVAAVTRLEQFGIIQATGADARTYLQGQLSFDLERLIPQRLELASCSSAQGRVQAVLWLVERSDGITLVLPAAMMGAALVRLRKFVLRAKVKIEAATERLVVYEAETPAEMSLRQHVEHDGVSLIRWPGEPRRVMMIAPPGHTATSDPIRQQAWHLADIRAGLPRIYPQTNEIFVAQMLNLDVLEGISFDKGCYTGQEIIARAHFRGAVKRRMFRFRAATRPPDPATRIAFDGNHAGEVVAAAATPEGCELLAVVTAAHADGALVLDRSPPIKLERLELPYAVPTA